MITFLIALLALFVGYTVYGRFVERMFAPDDRQTPAQVSADGVDFIPLKTWKATLIQLLNIAGLGPIFGALAGACFGPVVLLWIVFGSILGGAVHDYMSGMISGRNRGESFAGLTGRYLGPAGLYVMRVFSIVLLVLVGVVFVNTPAKLLTGDPFVPGFLAGVDSQVILYGWIAIIFLYYLMATLLPIDKVIGKIYPVFGILLLAMAVAIVVAFVVHGVDIPEVWEGLSNHHPQAETNPVFPMMFISIACGAISGFHATQSPLMARCMVNEKQARPIFYGAMIAEGVVALIWAAAAAYFFYGGDDSLYHGEEDAGMVKLIANTWFPSAIAFITLLGVVAAAVTSGDTALRSARLIVADFMHVDQKPIPKRLLVALPVFVLAASLLIFSLADAEGFQVIWRYFSWANQFLSMVTLWAITVFLSRHLPGKAWYWITLIPALFMSMVTISFLLVAEKEGLGSVLPRTAGYCIAAVITAALGVLFFAKKKRGETIK